MRNFFSCVEKDFKIFGRSKISAFVTVVIPLLVVLLISSAFSSITLHGIKIGVYNPEYNLITENILVSLEEQGYSTLRYGSYSDCENSVREGNTQICMVFPKNITEEGSHEPIIFYVDDSRINLAYSLIDKTKSQISSKSSELSNELVEELILTLKQVKKELPDYKKISVDSGDDLKEISKKAELISISGPDYESLSSKLEKARTYANSLNESASGVSELKLEINSAISELKGLEEDSSSLSESSEEIVLDSLSAASKLNNLSRRIDTLIKSLESAGVIEAEKIVSPIKTEIYSINKDLTNLDFLFPTLLALMMLFAGVILSSVLVIKEKKSRAKFRNFITPTGDMVFVVAMYFSAIIILFFQFSVLFAGLVFIGGIAIKSILLQLSVVLFISATLFIFLGMFIGYVFRTEETGILIAISVISLLLIFSNTIFPIESINPGFQEIAFYNPLVIVTSALKKVILFSAGLGSILGEIFLLGGFIVVLFLLTYLFRKGTKRFV